MKRKKLIFMSLIFIALATFVGWRATIFCNSSDFPENFELVVSRCRDAEIVDVSPNGEHIVVRVNFPETEYWLINNITRETIILPTTGFSAYNFVVDDLILFRLNGDFYLWQISSQQPQAVRLLDLDSEGNDAVYILADMDEIYYLEGIYHAIAFHVEEEDQSIERYIVVDSQHLWGIFNEMERFLIENEISFEKILAPHNACSSAAPDGGCYSHNGQYFADRSFIFTEDGDILTSIHQSELPIRSPESQFGLVGWTHDDTGLYFDFGHDYLFESRLPIFDYQLGRIPGGVGILKLPEQ